MAVAGLPCCRAAFFACRNRFVPEVRLPLRSAARPSPRRAQNPDKQSGEPDAAFDSFSTELGWAADSFWSYFSVETDLPFPKNAGGEDDQPDTENLLEVPKELNWCVVCGKKRFQGGARLRLLHATPSEDSGLPPAVRPPEDRKSLRANEEIAALLSKLRRAQRFGHRTSSAVPGIGRRNRNGAGDSAGALSSLATPSKP